MNTFFPELQKKLGFGCMRFPMLGQEIDEAQVKDMVDAFLAAGFNYFDTAKPYHETRSEHVVRRCLTSRYPRSSYILTDKLNPSFYEKEEDIRPHFESQLEACGVDYFDFYLFHANSAQRDEVFTRTNAYNIVKELKAEGKIRHIGTSFHDSPEVLDGLLTRHPEIEVVQLQFNYVDFVDPNVQSKACYDVCVKHGKPVFVMEPVKGGSLVNLPEDAVALMGEASAASCAIRFAASFPQVAMVLSGMSNREQMADNIATMGDFQPLNETEMEMIEKVRAIYQAKHRIPCTACRYCTPGCPAGLEIPVLFLYLNDLREEKEGAKGAYAAAGGNADSCIECGQCETQCPQHLQIRSLLKEVAKDFRLA